MRFWKGHSVGEWDGDTFVVTSTNYKQYATPYSTGPNVVMTERFTRLDEDTLQYEYTIDDPETYEAPFTARQQMVRTEDQVYEYACHEGNYSMPLTLRAARKMELDGRADFVGFNYQKSSHSFRLFGFQRVREAKHAFVYPGTV